MRIVVTVKPRAKKTGIVRFDDEHYTVSVAAPPAGGAANKAVIAALAEYFAVAPSRITIFMGKTARDKVIDIAE